MIKFDLKHTEEFIELIDALVEVWKAKASSDAWARHVVNFPRTLCPAELMPYYHVFTDRYNQKTGVLKLKFRDTRKTIKEWKISFFDTEGKFCDVF